MKLILTGGKTGGHIFPLINVAKKVKLNSPDIKIIYYGLKDSLEEKVCMKENITFNALNLCSKGIKINHIKDYYKEYKRVLKEFKNDRNCIVISSGGFVSLTVLSVCKRLDIKYILLEENKVFGKINKLFYKKAHKLCLTFPIENIKSNNVVITGNPSSQFTVDNSKFLLDKYYKYVLVIGGSLGSDILTKEALYLKDKLDSNFKVILIAGKTYEDVKKHESEKLIIYDFVEGLYNLMNKANYVIARAGSSTITELLSLEKPMILIPSLRVKDNHQYLNALYLQKNNSAILIDESKMSETSVLDTIYDLDKDIQKRSMLKVGCRNLKITNACDNVYTILREVLT